MSRELFDATPIRPENEQAMKKFAAMAEAHFVTVAPHNPMDGRRSRTSSFWNIVRMMKGAEGRFERAVEGEKWADSAADEAGIGD